MLSVLAVFIELGALAVWGVIYSLIRKAVSPNKNANPIPELFFSYCIYNSNYLGVDKLKLIISVY